MALYHKNEIIRFENDCNMEHETEPENALSEPKTISQQTHSLNLTALVVARYGHDDRNIVVIITAVLEAARIPGELNLIRWTMTSNRVMQEYI